MDLRAGYSVGTSAHSFNISVELNPGLYAKDGNSTNVTGVALLAGYQYL